LFIFLSIKQKQN
jgi:hypothetical protein